MCIRDSYIHRGDPYYINKIDHEKNEIHAIKTNDAYYTKPMITSSVLVQENYAIKAILHAQEVEIELGEVEVTDRVIGYRKIQTHSNEMCIRDRTYPPSYTMAITFLSGSSKVTYPAIFPGIIEIPVSSKTSRTTASSSSSR